MKAIFGVGLIFCALVARPSAAKTDGSRDFALYSDVCVHAETGDVLGTRIGLIKLLDGTYVFFQVAEGRLGTPHIIKLTTNDLNDGTLTFSISVAGKTKTFRGIIDSAKITGGFSDHSLFPNGETMVHLKKVRATSQTIPRC